MKVTSNTIIVNTVADMALKLLKERRLQSNKFGSFLPPYSTNQVYINGGRCVGHTTAAVQIYSHIPNTAVLLPNSTARMHFELLLPFSVSQRNVYTIKSHPALCSNKMPGFKLVIIDQASVLNSETINLAMKKYYDEQLNTQFLLLG